jgi:hypothetical protein
LSINTNTIERSPIAEILSTVYRYGEGLTPIQKYNIGATVIYIGYKFKIIDANYFGEEWINNKFTADKIGWYYSLDELSCSMFTQIRVSETEISKLNKR